MRALEECTDMDALVRKICMRRLAFLKALRTWGRSEKGWSRRVAAVQRAGFNLATGSVPAEASFIEAANAKADSVGRQGGAADRARRTLRAGGGVGDRDDHAGDDDAEPLKVEVAHRHAVHRR
jgi:lysozyme family protein